MSQQQEAQTEEEDVVSNKDVLSFDVSPSNCINNSQTINPTYEEEPEEQFLPAPPEEEEDEEYEKAGFMLRRLNLGRAPDVTMAFLHGGPPEDTVNDEDEEQVEEDVFEVRRRKRYFDLVMSRK